MLETGWRGGISAEVGRRGGDDEADKWGPHGGDRGRRRSRRVRKLEEEAASVNYAKAAQAGMGRACMRGLREEGGAGGGGWPG
jgi:hypothetical protein